MWYVILFSLVRKAVLRTITVIFFRPPGFLRNKDSLFVVVLLRLKDKKAFIANCKAVQHKLFQRPKKIICMFSANFQKFSCSKGNSNTMTWSKARKCIVAQREFTGALLSQREMSYEEAPRLVYLLYIFVVR